MSKEALYQERLARVRRAIDLEPVDRIPTIYMGHAFAPRYMGVTMAKYCSDGALARETTLAAMERLGDLDGINMAPVGRPGGTLSGFWLSRMAMPGRELPEDSLWQVQEAEVMGVEDYEAIVNEGWRSFTAAYMPRIIDDMDEYRAIVAEAAAALPTAAAEFRERGFVVISAGTATIPFEYFCGARSMAQFFLDLYRRPEKVQAASDAIMPELIQRAVRQAERAGTLGIWIGGWRAASSLVSPRHWNRFGFPYLQQLVEALAARGVVSVLHLDQDWTRDLERLRELPAKRCLLNPDGMTDIRKAKAVLGDRMAIMGDLPASIFATGTPEDIYAYVRDLVRDIGPTGLILCPGCDAPVNTKPENMEAFVAASREYGRV